MRTKPTRLERGAAPIAFLLLVPVVLMLAEIAVLGGRVTATTGEVRTAAREAARQATLAQTETAAGAAVQSAMARVLITQGVECTNPQARLAGGTNWTRGGMVEVEASCDVQLSDLSLLNLPLAAKTITVTVLEPIDYWRVVE